MLSVVIVLAHMHVPTLFTLFLLVSILKRPRTPPAAPGMVDYQSSDHEQLMKRLRPAQSVEEVTRNIFFRSAVFTNTPSCLAFSQLAISCFAMITDADMLLAA